MADVAPAKLSLRHLTFVILVHRLVCRNGNTADQGQEQGQRIPRAVATTGA
jgi:hypothetical protein